MNFLQVFQFLPQIKDMQDGWTRETKPPVCVSVLEQKPVQGVSLE